MGSRLQTEEYTRINDRAVVGTGLASSPEGIAWVQDVQRAVYDDAPADTQAAQDSADAADAKAVGAQTSADNAQLSADNAQSTANDAGARADEAYQLADTKVTKEVGPQFSEPIATPLRTALPAYAGTASATYTQTEVQALMDHVATLTRIVAALIVDGRASKSLTN